MILSQIEFAYNRSLHQSIGMSSFKVVYGTNPIGPLDLVSYPTKKQFSEDVDEKAKNIKKHRKHVKASIENQNEMYTWAANKHKKTCGIQCVW